ncbi:MAG: serine/threonine protein kinase, partial [Myxococcales bacterium]|nr:serine/threonine protein kinase [Myxococcales bacterium]
MRIYGASAVAHDGEELAYQKTLAAPHTTAPSPAVGQTIGRYRVIGRLGEGGMGAVLAAHDPELDRTVALKILHESAGDERGELRDRLAREARAMAKLAHPNVVAVYDVGADPASGQLFVTMELVDGTTLRDWLRTPRSSRAILDVFMAAGTGLAAAHAAGLVHRDFKPENVLVGRDGRVRVGDFGLARPPRGAAASDAPLSPTLTRTGAIIGTPAYMAPEQFLGEAADARSDQFAFAVALFEALRGERPFAGASLRELSENVVAGRLSPSVASGPRWHRRFFAR